MGVNICVGGQMEAVCRSLLELNIKVRDLGQMFVRYPALITSPADKLRERVSSSNLKVAPVVEDNEIEIR
jgi:hypothetical protein